jgi:hypothetical protein
MRSAEDRQAGGPRHAVPEVRAGCHAMTAESCFRCALARRLVNLQADDSALWFKAETATEAYLQRALRMLHQAIDGEDPNWPLAADQRRPEATP